MIAFTKADSLTPRLIKGNKKTINNAGIFIIP